MPKDNETATPAAPVAATLSELKRDFPASTAEWRENCLEHGLTSVQCKDAWIKHLENQLTAANTKADEQAARTKALEEEKAAQAASAGNKPLETKSGSAVESTDAREQIRSLVEEKMRETGKPRHDCHAMVMRAHPELREALVADANKRS